MAYTFFKGGTHHRAMVIGSCHGATLLESYCDFLGKYISCLQLHCYVVLCQTFWFTPYASLSLAYWGNLLKPERLYQI